MAANLEYYRVFYHVAKCGSVTKAAAELSLSQPAVSQSIRQLENVLGMRAANLEYYRVFYHVAKCGSVTKAAAELSLSQPAVSQSIRQLENVLGMRLFVRSARGLTLTAEGKVLYSYAEAGCGQFEAGERNLLQMKNLECGEITIGASDMTLRFFLLWNAGKLR